MPDATIKPADGPCHHPDGGILGVQARGVRKNFASAPCRLGSGRQHLLHEPCLQGRVLERHTKLPMQRRKVPGDLLSAPLGPLSLGHIAGTLPQSVQNRFQGLSTQAAAIVLLPVPGLPADDHTDLPKCQNLTLSALLLKGLTIPASLLKFRLLLKFVVKMHALFLKNIVKIQGFVLTR